MFEENMKEIKENYQKEKQSNRLKKDQEIKVLSEMEKNIEKSKDREVQLVKTLWEQERMKLDLISKDEERLKHKLQAIYRKNNPWFPYFPLTHKLDNQFKASFLIIFTAFSY